MARLYLTIIIVGIIGGFGWFGYNYYVDTQTRIGILTANNAKLETAQKQTVEEFKQYRLKVTEEIENFKNELKKQQELNNELSSNLKQSIEKNQAIAKLLANTDIIKNSLADPKATEEKINEEVDKFFGDIGCATGKCMQSNTN
mgnify:FL=1